MKNKGMFLEELINKTNKYYKDNSICLTHKKNLDILPTNINGKHVRGILLSKSTVDYFGICNGIHFEFEAKSTKIDTLPKANIKPHQIKHLNQVKAHGGVSFIIVYFSKHKRFFLVKNYEEKINIDTCTTELFIKYPGIIDYIKNVV